MADEKRKKGVKETQSARVIRFVIIVVLIAAVVIAVYVRITNQSKNSAKHAEENMSELQTLKLYDMDTQYPKNARDVVKMHCRLLKCVYNESLDKSEYEVLNTQMRELFSEELLDSNPESRQFDDLLEDVDDFQSAGKIYISYTVADEENIAYSTVDGVEYAMVLVTCNIKESNVTDAIEEEYLLCKEDGRWKIVGWQGLSTEDTTEEN